MEKKKQLQLKSMFLLFVCLMFAFSIACGAAEKKVALNKTSVFMKKNASVQLKLKGASGKVKWSSSKKSVATVTSSGKVKGRSAGECVITAIYKKKRYACVVTVDRPAVSRVVAKNPAGKNKGRILLAGSSSIARWSSAAKAFAPYEIVNMAVSGTTIEQWSKWYKSMIVSYEPEAVVLYVGGNDLWKKKSPAQTAKLVCDTMKKLHRELPDTAIYFVSVYTNISRKSISKQILAYNKKVKQFCSKYNDITYVDLATAFSNSGTLLKDLLCDGLHPNAKGYKIWNDVVAAKVKGDLKSLGIEPSRGSSGVVSDVNTSDTGITDSNEVVTTGTEVYMDEISGELSQVVIK